MIMRMPGIRFRRNRTYMKIKLAKYIAKLLVSNGITQCFSVTGGGAMHLNDGFGHDPGMHVLYMHHEQACAIAAESYARIYNRPACLCVTTGPGGTNAITGVVGAWLDSIPMIVISGQVRYDNTARWSGVGIRAMGDQEFDITRSIDCMTKYSRMVLDPMSIRYEVEKCIYLSQTGRPGPCWLDIPVDIQGMYIDDKDLEPFDVEAYEMERNRKLHEIEDVEDRENLLERNRYAFSDMEDGLLGVSFLKQKWQNPCEIITKDSPVVMDIINRIEAAERPVFYTGNGLRIAGAHDLFLKVADRLGIPVVVGWNGIDIIPSIHPLYSGQPGGRGDRVGNFTVQNADFILSIGSRLNIRQVGYNFPTWAREAYTMVCDIDEEELKKPSVHVDVPIHADAGDLLSALLEKLDELGYTGHGSEYADSDRLRRLGYTAGDSIVFKGGRGLPGMNWWETCAYWRSHYGVYRDEFAAHGSDEPVNIYEFYNVLSRALSEDQVTVVGNGTPCVAGAQAYIVKDGTRFISQDAIASMGYDLPAAIGAYAACHEITGKTYPHLYDREPEIESPEERNERQLTDKAYALGQLEAAKKDPYWTGTREHYPAYHEHDVICHTGDGSIMMNLQELETISSHRMPIKIFLINNGGYHSIRQTQQNLFSDEPLVGVGDDSHDLAFPDFERIADAFGISYVRAEHNTDLAEAIGRTLRIKGPVLCEVFVSVDQPFEPRSAAKKNPDGSISSPPLEDMAPFLSDEEMDANMIVKRVET